MFLCLMNTSKFCVLQMRLKRQMSCNLTLSITRLLSSCRMIDYVFVIASVNDMNLVKNMVGNVCAHIHKTISVLKQTNKGLSEL